MNSKKTTGLVNNSNSPGYSSSNFGTIKRSNSKPQKEERPSTAPAKENKIEEKPTLTGNNSMKRLPSPAIKSNNPNSLLSNTTKNYSNYSSTGSKPYRSPSPANPMMRPNNTLSNNKIGLSNSLKGMPINNMMKKWK